MENQNQNQSQSQNQSQNISGGIKCRLCDTPLGENNWDVFSETVPLESPGIVRLHGDGEWDFVTVFNREIFRVFIKDFGGEMMNYAIYMGREGS